MKKLARVTLVPSITLPSEVQVSTVEELCQWLYEEFELEQQAGTYAWNTGKYLSAHLQVECYPLEAKPTQCLRCGKWTASVLTPEPMPWCNCQWEHCTNHVIPE